MFHIILCVSALPSESTWQGSMMFFMAQSFPPNSPKMYPESHLLVQQLRLQSFSLLFSHRKGLSWLDEDWDASNVPSNEIQKQKKTLVWSMDVCSYKSLHELTDLEERLHKRKPLWRPPIFSTSLLTMERAFKDLESQETSLLMSGSRFLRIVAWRFLRPSQLAASFLCT